LSGCATLPMAPPAHPDPMHGWRLDCQLGANEAARATWLQPCEARASHTVGPKQEVWLAVNPVDPANVVIAAKDNNPANSASCTWNGVYVTKDAGRTWTDVVIGGPYAERKPGELWYGYACNTDPMFRFAADGTLHYAVEMYNLGGTNSHGQAGASPTTGRPILDLGWRLLLATSHDGGLNWTEVVDLVDGDGVAALNDYSRMAISPKTGSILTAIGLLSGTDFTIPAIGAPEPVGGTARETATHSYCWVTASRDHGKSADPAAVVAQDPPKGIACEAIAVAPDGTVVLAGETGGSAVGGLQSAGQHLFARSVDDGRTFDAYGGGFGYKPMPGHLNSTRFRASSGIELAFAQQGPHAGRLYALYDAEDSGLGADVYMRHSDDLGRTWSNASRVNQDAGQADQWNGNFAVAGSSLHAFFMDRSHDAANHLIDITHAVSIDEGATWTSERVSSVSYDGDLGVHQEGFPFIGDYIGTDAVGDDVWGGFPDASNGAVTVIAAAHVHRSG
ncbi:MAG: sialidase family protein, partial [Thermoplasmatota archaeon]